MQAKSIYLAALALCCSCSPLPEPRPLVLTADPSGATQAAGFMTAVGNTTFVGTTPEQERATLALLEYLVDEFGEPQFRGPVTIEVKRNAPEHAVTTVGSDRGRKIVLDSLNFFDSQLHFVVHELFHGYFQPTSFLASASEPEIESWATYAQFRFEYRHLKSNDEILHEVLRDYSLDHSRIEELRQIDRPWQELPNDVRHTLYAVNAMPLFRLSHSEVLARLRQVAE